MLLLEHETRKRRYIRGKGSVSLEHGERDGNCVEQSASRAERLDPPEEGVEWVLPTIARRQSRKPPKVEPQNLATLGARVEALRSHRRDGPFPGASVHVYECLGSGTAKSADSPDLPRVDDDFDGVFLHRLGDSSRGFLEAEAVGHKACQSRCRRIARHLAHPR